MNSHHLHHALASIQRIHAQFSLLIFTLILATSASSAQTCPPMRRPARMVQIKRIVFVSERDHNYEIYIMGEDGRRQRNLTRNSADDMSPRLSPDATHIVFQTNRDGNNEIYSMKVDGSDLRRLTNNTTEDLAPTWSPDGRRIVFTRQVAPGQAKLFVMNNDGSREAPLTTELAYDSFPSWSPDGRWIAYSSRRGTNTDIFVIRLATCETTRLTDDPAMDTQPRWSPNSLQILFARQTGSDDDVWVMNRDGSRQINVTRDPGASDLDAVWARSGRVMAFVKNPRGRGLNISMRDVFGGRLTQLTHSNHDIQPDW